MQQPSLKDYCAVILCGGKSSRMGEDKALLPFDSYSTLAQYQYERLQPFFKKVYLSSKTNKFDFIDDEHIIFDQGDIFSPMIALQTILQHCQEKKLFILTVDTPFVSIASIQKLFIASKNAKISVAKTQRLHNLCGFYHKEILYYIEELLEKDIHKIGLLLDKFETNVISFPNENEFLNLNKKEDYLKALSIIS